MQEVTKGDPTSFFYPDSPIFIFFLYFFRFLNNEYNIQYMNNFKKTLRAIIVLIASLMTTTAWAQITGAGTSDDPYVLHTAADWVTFANRVDGSRFYGDSYFKLSDTWDNSANPVTVTVGTKDWPFTGSFDGNFRTLTVNINETSKQGTAPFREINEGAIIKNLTVVGNVNGTTHAAGLVGVSRNYAAVFTNVIENCTVEVNVTVNTGSNKHMGGVVGHGMTSYLTIKNTVFCGTMSNGGDYAGGLMGWSDGNTLNIDNCIFAGSYTGNGLFHPIAVRGNNNPMTLNVNRAYYTTEPTLTDESYIAVAGTRVYLSPPEDLFSKACQLIDGHQYYVPCTVNGIASFYAYNDGNAITLGYTVKGIDGTVLTKNTDYTETITNSNGETVTAVTDMGDYTLTLTGLPAGGCFGSYSQTFSVIEANNTGAVLIEDAAGWEAFAQRVNNGETGLDGMLIADIDLGNSQTMVGTSNNKYRGRFDGKGHTLTVQYKTTAENTAPFRFVEGGRIYNLHTAGTIQTSAKFAAGIVSNYYGERSALMNSRSSVTIISSVNGDGTHGGLIAVSNGGTAEIPLLNHCVFDGKLLTTNGTTLCGGLVGFSHSSFRISYCLYAPAPLEEGETEISSDKTFARFAEGKSIYSISSYYTRTLGSAQGSNGSGLSAEQLASRLGSHRHVEDGNVVPLYDRTLLKGDGTQGSPYLITSDEDWETFAYTINSGSRMIRIYVELTNDITVHTTAGDRANSFQFSGIFQGNGHTMTLDMNTSSNYGGPFHIAAGSINNLHVTGILRTSGQYAGGVVGFATGGTDLYNCWSSVTIISSYNGSGYHGGLVGVDNWTAGIVLHNCLFDGKLLTTGGTTNCSGLVGEAYNHLSIYNCLSSPAELAEGETPCGSCNTLYHINKPDVMQGQATNYYLPASYMTNLQGDDATPYTPEELVGLLGRNEWSLLDGKPVPIYKVSDLVGSGTDTDPYLIRNIDDWRALSANVRSGRTYDDQYFLMTADIDLGDDQSKVGTDRYGFAGHFDGGDYTLTVHYVSTADHCAPFSYLKGNSHKIRRLHTAGTIQTSGRYAAGIISNNWGFYDYVGTTLLERCRSSVIITSTREGEGIIGGLIATHTVQLSMIDCLFDGSLLGENTHTCSGLLGVNTGNYVYFGNSLYNPKEQTVGTTNSCTLARNNGAYSSALNIYNCYYTRTLGTVQGTDGSQMTGAELVQALGADNWTLEDGQPVPRVTRPVELNGSGTEDDPYLIACEQDWNNLANNLEAERNYQDKLFLQTADITVTTMVGTSSHPFNGIYEGDGHTLTFNAGTADAYQNQQHCAPFRYVKNATVKNLRTQGDIYTSAQFAAGLAASVSGDFTVTNCLSDITINSSVDGDGTHGGFVARALNGTTVFTGCVFSGELLGTTTHSCGGFVGWTETNNQAKVTFRNCLFAPQACSFSSNNSNVFSRTRNEGQSLSFINAYFSYQLGNAQGKKTRRISGDEYCTVAIAGAITEYGVSGLRSNGWGIEYASEVYSGLGHKMSLSLGCTPPPGYAVEYFVASDGTLSGTENPYTLAMPRSDVTISATFIGSEWDGDGTEESPYLIYNHFQLDTLSSRVNKGNDYDGIYFKLCADIAYDPNMLTIDNDSNGVNESNFTAIGTSDHLFKGHLDGDYYTISGIRIVKTDGDQGLFGRTNTSKLTNIVLSDTDITGGTNTGGIVGHKTGGEVTNCHVTSTVTIRTVRTEVNYHGGIVGYNNSGAISRCSSAATLTIENGNTNCANYGGIVGYSRTGSIKYNLAIGAVIPRASSNYGAVYGSKSNSATFQYNYRNHCTMPDSSINDINANDGCVYGYLITLDEFVTSSAIQIILPEHKDLNSEGTALETVAALTYNVASYGTTITLGNTLPAGCIFDHYTVRGNAIQGNTFTMGSYDVNVGIVFSVDQSAVSRAITSYDEGGYVLIASPIGTVNPDNVTNMLENEYDLYRFNQAAEKEWENYKQEGDHYHFDLEVGCGYLYANSSNVTLVFPGTPYSGNGEVMLSKTAGGRLEGWNLVGNPFAVTAYIADGRSFYTMNAQGNEIVPADRNSIAPMEGIFVIATNDGETMTFTTNEPQNNNGKGLVLNLSKGPSVIDRAIVRFDEGRQLPKFQIRENSTKLYIPQDNGNYAVVSAEHQGEMPVNFKAEKNGTYTLNLIAEGMAFNYLHLIDNLTGNDVNLLQTPYYTFEAKTGDYASRFKLVFATSDANEDSQFAFISNGEIIVKGEGTLQVIDMLGHILISRLIDSGSSLLSSDFLTNGVYVLRLINGEMVRTQKIIVK